MIHSLCLPCTSDPQWGCRRYVSIETFRVTISVKHDTASRVRRRQNTEDTREFCCCCCCAALELGWQLTGVHYVQCCDPINITSPAVCALARARITVIWKKFSPCPPPSHLMHTPVRLYLIHISWPARNGSTFFNVITIFCVIFVTQF